MNNDVNNNFVTCSNCKTKMKSDVKYCPNCGCKKKWYYNWKTFVRMSLITYFYFYLFSLFGFFGIYFLFVLAFRPEEVCPYGAGCNIFTYFLKSIMFEPHMIPFFILAVVGFCAWLLESFPS